MIVNNNNFSNTAFSGYKNVICNHIKTDKMHFVLLSMQLDNNNGNELSKFNEYRALAGKNTDKDVLTVMYTKASPAHESLIFDDDLISVGKELKNTYNRNKFIQKYKNKEKEILKAYTLLAQITRKMMNNPLCPSDKEIGMVFKETMQSITPALCKNDSEAFAFLQHSILKKCDIGRPAAALNSIVAKHMGDFFK